MESAGGKSSTEIRPGESIVDWNKRLTDEIMAKLRGLPNNDATKKLTDEMMTSLSELPDKIDKTYADAVCRHAKFEINVFKDTFKFNASHFVAYSGFRERLHGHSYRASVKLIGGNKIGRDGYVLDFGCVKSAVAAVCKTMNEYFLVPMLSEVLKITVEEAEGSDETGDGSKICGDCGSNNNTCVKLEEEQIQMNKRRRTNNNADCVKIKLEDESTNGGDDITLEEEQTKKQQRSNYPGSVTIVCEDGSTFVFPRQDCLLLPIMHSTAEELAIYLYGKILSKLDALYLHQRGVSTMEVTVSEAVGQDATFRCAIPGMFGNAYNEFDVARFIREGSVPVMPCATETVAAEQRNNHQ